jgi:hypothetical protein
MEHTVEYDSAENIIVASVQGEVGLPELKEFARSVVSFAKQAGCFHILTDLRGADLNVTTVELYFHPENITEIILAYELETHLFKRAILAAKEHELLEFYETVSRNRSHNTRLFYNIEEAKNWLREK